MSILFVLTSHDKLGTTGKQTGYWLSELAHPYNHLQNHFPITIASPKGGLVPLDPGSIEASKDQESLDFLNNPEVQEKLANSVKLSEINAADYECCLLPGGHGPMFDLANDETLHSIIRDIYEEGGIVAGVCHGPAGFVNVKLSNGEYLVKGKRFTGFANTEEETVGLTEVVPFLLEDAAKKNGAVYEKGADWAVHVVVDGNLITGQNPASATKMAEAVHAALI